VAGSIDYDNALAHADSPNDLRLRIKVSEMKRDEVEKKEKGLKLKIDNRK
jgi:Tfp pilus assembly ATPase PilU